MNKKILATALLTGVVTFGATSTFKEDGTFDTKGQEVKIQVLIKEQEYQDALYYSPADWDLKTEVELNAEKQKRYDDWKKFVEEESKKVTPEKIDEIIL